MKVQLRFFASVREAVAVSEERVDLPDSVATVGELRAWLRLRGDVWQAALADGRALRMACDHRLTGAQTRLTDGCEVAFFPPVTGG